MTENYPFLDAFEKVLISSYRLQHAKPICAIFGSNSYYRFLNDIHSKYKDILVANENKKEKGITYSGIKIYYNPFIEHNSIILGYNESEF